MKRIMKLVFIVMTFILLVGCTTGDDSLLTGNSQLQEDSQEEIQYYDAYATINSDEISAGVSIVELIFNPADPAVMASRNDVIALVTVLSIDGGSNVNGITGEYMYPYTYGKLLVHDVYKGDIEPNEEINYTRGGGIITWSSYYDSLLASQKEKLASMPQTYHQPYVKEYFDGDIDIKAGSTYLVYMVNSNSREDAYSIQGLAGGLREVRVTNDQDTFSSATSSQIEVYNNFTGEWESLDEVIPQ